MLHRRAPVFDHAVIMVRGRQDTLPPHFSRQGFQLSDPAMHNLVRATA